MYTYTTHHPGYGPNTVTVDSGAATASAALRSIQRFLGRENKRLMAVNHEMTRRGNTARLPLVRLPRDTAALRHETFTAA
jgi:hypothetical protein